MCGRVAENKCVDVTEAESKSSFVAGVLVDRGEVRGGLQIRKCGCVA